MSAAVEGSPLGVEISLDAAACAAASEDFGHLTTGEVAGVVRPTTIEALQALVRWARDRGAQLTPRAAGNSQSGQSLPDGGFSLDLSAFCDVHVDEDARVARIGAGARWRDVLGATAPKGLAPEVLPLNLDLTVGGLLSAGGYGSTSHRYGLAVSTVRACDVVIGTGEKIRATWSERPDVLGAVLGGVGHFGAIVGAEIRLRDLAPRIRTFTLLFDDLTTCLRAQVRLQADARVTHQEALCSASIQGLRRVAGGGGQPARRVPFARWFFVLHVSVEHAPDAAPAEAMFEGLGHREIVLVDEDDAAAFAARYDARFEGMRMTGAWGQIHPWLEAFLPMDVAERVVPALLEQLPLFLGDLHRVSVLGGGELPDLLAVPEGRPLVAFAVLPVGVPHALERPALGALAKAHEALIAAGGKRYLSGWMFEPDTAAWERHFGDRMPAWQARKKALDPSGIFASRLFQPRRTS